MRRNVHTRALERAAEVLGGEQALAHYLSIDQDLLRQLMNGTTDLPQSFFLKLVDVLLDPGFAELQQRIFAAVASKRVDGEDASVKAPT